MSALILLIPVALFLGFMGLLAFMWALGKGQFEDPDGAAARILNDAPTNKSHTPKPSKIKRLR